MNYQRYFGPALFVLGGAAILAVLGVPVLSYLPFLAVAVICPLMMFFMMQGMDHGGGRSDDSDDADRPSAHRH